MTGLFGFNLKRNVSLGFSNYVHFCVIRSYGSLCPRLESCRQNATWFQRDHVDATPRKVRLQNILRNTSGFCEHGSNIVISSTDVIM